MSRFKLSLLDRIGRVCRLVCLCRQSASASTVYICSFCFILFGRRFNSGLSVGRSVSVLSFVVAVEVEFRGINANVAVWHGPKAISIHIQALLAPSGSRIFGLVRRYLFMHYIRLPISMLVCIRYIPVLDSHLMWVPTNPVAHVLARPGMPYQPGTIHI